MGIGYGYSFNFYHFQFMPSVDFLYRNYGGEVVTFGYMPSNMKEPVIAIVNYNSPGVSLMPDLNWMPSEHFGLGVRAAWQYFPFEKGKLTGQMIDYTDPDKVAGYKPGKSVFTLDAKICLRF